MKQFSYLAILSLFVTVFIGCGGGDAGDDMETDTTGTMEDTTAMTGPMMDTGGDTLQVALSGSAIRNNAGDPDGSGTAEIVLNPGDGSVCFEIEVENIEEPGAAHIHSGASDADGPPVVNLDIGNNGLSGCVDADAATIEAIQASPSDYYVNVHNAEFGGGAVRGQLGSAM